MVATTSGGLTEWVVVIGRRNQAEILKLHQPSSEVLFESGYCDCENILRPSTIVSAPDGLWPGRDSDPQTLVREFNDLDVRTTSAQIFIHRVYFSNIYEQRFTIFITLSRLGLSQSEESTVAMWNCHGLSSV